MGTQDVTAEDAMVRDVAKLIEDAKTALDSGRVKLAAAALDEVAKEAREAAKALRKGAR